MRRGVDVGDQLRIDILSCKTATYHLVTDINCVGRTLRVFVEFAAAREARNLF